MKPIAYAFKNKRLSLIGWSLATVNPTYENTYTPKDDILEIKPLGFDYQGFNIPFEQWGWAWKKQPDHRALRGKYIHRHKNKKFRQHAFNELKIVNMKSWAIGKREPIFKDKTYIIRKLYFLN
jgi:hypothetical protein